MKCSKPNGDKVCFIAEKDSLKDYSCPLLSTCPKLIKSKLDNYRRALRKWGTEIVLPCHHNINIDPIIGTQTILPR